ncbi:histone deacetylase complex subunit SAP18 [Tanacetum coccineum]|uniref:Histone deacetylase complex subunit SAP18 n=1 Tax=Tanacetum coccineum TaxID=301880 RepID=A0ABQ4X997_9ASTR
MMTTRRRNGVVYRTADSDDEEELQSATGCTESDARRCKRGAPDSLSDSHMVRGHHNQAEFAIQDREPKDEVRIYTWMDAALCDFTYMVKRMAREARRKDALLRGSFINTIPEVVVKIATTEIDLEAPAALEPETDDTHEDIIKGAAEAIISISSFIDETVVVSYLLFTIKHYCI